jgi:hypothetical protein
MAIRKVNQVIEAYDTISVEDFEQARKIVGLPVSIVNYILTLSSTLTGLAVETSSVFPFACLTLLYSTPRP